MTQNLLTDLGEEYYTKNGLDAITVEVGVYDDSTDGLSDGSDVGDITTEPGNANYARQSVTFSAADLSGDWGVDNDSQFKFDFSDVQNGDSADQRIDTAFVTYTFTASDTGDSGSTTHLIANPEFGNSSYRETGAIDELVIDAGDLTITID